MDVRLVFSKTAKGVAEVAARSAALTLAARRILIMVDGKRTAADLAVLLSPGEIDEVLAALETQGFIVRNGGAAASRPSSHPTPAPSTLSGPPDVNIVGREPEERNLLTLEEAKRRAVRELLDRLGPDGETMSMRIERCKSAAELSERLREAERLVAGMNGEGAAQDYVRALRRAR
ncbi:MAG: hypothetical protein ING59_09575 [Burkholderiales bacterium]|jgi:hypothetical protein|nr:hypothetical protein [Burkholderiales bacterium]